MTSSASSVRLMGSWMCIRIYSQHCLISLRQDCSRQSCMTWQYSRNALRDKNRISSMLSVSSKCSK